MESWCARCLISPFAGTLVAIEANDHSLCHRVFRLRKRPAEQEVGGHN